MINNTITTPSTATTGQAQPERQTVVEIRREAPWQIDGSAVPASAGQGSDPRWLTVLHDGLKQQPMRLEARADEQIVGVLPLALVHSRLFGRFLVSLPYLNSAGVLSTGEAATQCLLDAAVKLADELDVRYLELRQESEIAHPSFDFARKDKVNMRLSLPDSAAELWDDLKAKVRNQVKKGRSYDLNVRWGRDALISDFYRVFSRNMRDLGTPVYSRGLFASILSTFGDDAELCIVYRDGQPAAGALLFHGGEATQVPSASSLREFNKYNVNMLMYWNLLERAIQRGSRTFDFGRSTEGSGTHRFKKQWGATPSPSIWQYYLRRGNTDDMRPQSAKNQRLIRIWRKLPVWLTRVIGPPIVRGIP